ncbi:carbohydrate-binding domain-containing protein [Arthrobacter sp. zg-Y40]|uniref:carbohydrate-binding domain-containing protein n=1 Tax=unclassified Arthrobacter TaxID=235627 RepID=UPI001D1363E5|nr:MULTISPECIES: carbohydrate-binding domain-containing protein [unclassified Arthrobacter]MCC3278575.1 carbohydrate-binding domain-containing protein [Arthrobacter sp. zg-Y40]MDK1326346.1 carbohydrate-binding domain-containing protein [Arthrobacter sp. zg-Y1143]
MHRRSVTTSVAAFALVTFLAGCSGSVPAGSDATAAAEAAPSAFGPTVSAGDIAEETHYDDDDLIWDAADEVPVALGGAEARSGVEVDGGTVTLAAAGTYRLSGSLADGQVVVAAGKEDLVRVILDGVDLTSSSGSPFVITSANEVMVYLEDGTSNTLRDAATYADTADDAPDAALYSMEDLTIAGRGTLAVEGNAADGIVSKDGLVLAGGGVTVNAAGNGIKGKDYVVLAGGRYAVTAAGDGVKSTNDEDADRGWFSIYGGELAVSSGDDGVKAETLLTVNGGAVTVSESAEGMEAAHIAINGGSVDVTASDDGINAAGGSSASAETGGGDVGGGVAGPAGGEGSMPEPPATPEGGMAPGPVPPSGEFPAEGPLGPGGGEMEVGDYSIVITGGTVTANADGDGLDSNGTATISGGTVVVHGPTSNGNGALDVNGSLTVDGGTLLAGGSAGMAQAPSDTSSQSGVQFTFGSTVAAETLIRIAAADGTVVASFTALKDTASVIYSAADISAGAAYTAYTGGTEGTLDGAEDAGTATGGEYSPGFAPGF